MITPRVLSDWVRSAVSRSCALGARIQYLQIPDTGHLDLIPKSCYNTMERWIADRFAGTPPPWNCPAGREVTRTAILAVYRAWAYSSNERVDLEGDDDQHRGDGRADRAGADMGPTGPSSPAWRRSARGRATLAAAGMHAANPSLARIFVIMGAAQMIAGLVLALGAGGRRRRWSPS